MKTSVILSLAALALCTAPLAAQDENASEANSEAGVEASEEVPRPVSELNLKRDDIPDVLAEAAAEPYAHELFTTCSALSDEIERIDAVLGPDLDLGEDDSHGINIRKIARNVVGSFIPLRRVINRVSGADAHEKQFQRAIHAGAVRRGFLKGLGQQRGCAYPARPASTSDVAAVEAAAAADEGSEE